MSVARLVLISSVTLLIVGCESDSDNKVAKAQQCLDYAKTAGAAELCLNDVGGISSAKASKIRCAAIYLMRDFNETKFQAAFDKILKKDGAGDPMAGMMTQLAFSNGQGNRANGTAVADANFAMSECTNSGSVGLTMLSGITATGTAIASLIPAWNPASPPAANDPALIATLQNLASNSADPVTQATMGTAVLAISNTYCAGAADAGNADVCTKVKQATIAGGGDPAAIGKAIAAYLATP
jgi:hypothetical protein